MALVEQVIGLSINKPTGPGTTGDINAVLSTRVFDNADGEEHGSRSYPVELTAQEKTQLRTFIGNLLARTSFKRTPENV